MNELSWELALFIGVVTIFASMLAAAVSAQICKGKPKCFASNPDPMTMGYLECHRCDERDECLK